MIVIPAILESIRSLLDKTLKVTFVCNELTPDQAVSIVQSLQQFGYFAFKTEPFVEREKEALEALKSSYEDQGKTHSQRLRNVLYRLWEQDNSGFKDFDSYYKLSMENCINHFKAKLE